ncbi:EamA family transporter [Enterococcus sp. JM9B]|uniref:EamA family transporter n=1 Tax=Enterococcus sp. JM9B TaxID=1857216 RepID=UPI001374E29B|nr:EamA family transporter [Enterococcus sp. JM9B]KAF1304830.1 hypothetical protein BAU16_01260 [Enterococcus sp. JM9B]
MILFFIYVILSTSGLVLFKLGSINGGISINLAKSAFSFHIPLLSLLGLLCYMVSFLMWMYIISKTDISFIVPLGVALTNLAVLLSSYFILHETMSYTTIIGAALIIIGAVILNIK